MFFELKALQRAVLGKLFTSSAFDVAFQLKKKIQVFNVFSLLRNFERCDEKPIAFWVGTISVDRTQ